MSMRTVGHQTSVRYGYYALAVLFVVALFNYIDRSIVAILQEPLKRDLGLSDTQLGALTGLSFALFYTTCALPIARLADNTVRKNLIVVALVLWSGMTALGGLATSFAMLVLCRIGVAVGEAGCAPTSHSLLSDYFPPIKRGTVIAIWGISLPVGTILGFSLGGWLNDTVGWRGAFAIVGLLGIACAPLVWLLREPQRGQYDGAAARAKARDSLPLKIVVKTLWNLRSFRYMALAGALHAFTHHTIHYWNSSFYIRVHGLPLNDVALYLAVVFGIGGGIGTLLGGIIADRTGRKDARWYAWVPALSSLLFVPTAVVQYFASGPYASLAVGLLGAIFINAYMPPLIATAQSLVPSNMRAFTSAVIVIVVALFGMGLGPLVTGLISDILIESYGMKLDSLRYAISASLVFCLAAACVFAYAGRFLPSELATIRAGQTQDDLDEHLLPVPARS